jgi:hypothetical protein
MTNDAVKEFADFDAALDELYELGADDPMRRQAMINLLLKGFIADSGQRRNGQIVWVTTPEGRKFGNKPGDLN